MERKTADVEVATGDLRLKCVDVQTVWINEGKSELDI